MPHIVADIYTIQIREEGSPRNQSNIIQPGTTVSPLRSSLPGPETVDARPGNLTLTYEATLIYFFTDIYTEGRGFKIAFFRNSQDDELTEG